MVLLLLACLGGPGDTGGFPVWGGTQIGEEGDDCPVNAFESADSYEALREVLTVSRTGTFVSAFQGSAELSFTVDPTGLAWDVVDCSEQWSTAVDADVVFESELVTIDSTVRLSSELAHVFLLPEVDGSLSPGELPEDAGQLYLEMGLAHPFDSGQARWLLERPGGWEEAPAGTWTLD